MNGAVTTKRLLEMQQLEILRDDIEPMLTSALQIWRKVVRRDYSSLPEGAHLCEALALKLQACLVNLSAISDGGWPASGNGNPLKDVGETGQQPKDEG